MATSDGTSHSPTTADESGCTAAPGWAPSITARTDGGSDDNTNVYEGAGVVWSTAKTVTSVTFYNGSCDQYGNGVFSGNVAVQFSTDGTTWTTSNWTITPAYPANSCGASPTAAGQSYTFSGPAVSNIKGVRIVGQVHTSGKPSSWHAHVTEVRIFN